MDDRLTRGSAKWTTYPADVLPAWVAEMDFPLAAPVKAALSAAVANDDAGYLGARPAGMIEAFVGFAARRLGWTVDPAQVRPVTDVMVGVEEVLAVLTSPGAGVVINPPVYPPFFADVVHSGRSVVEVPLLDGGALDVDGIADAFAAGAQALLLCNPHNPTGRVPWLEELSAIADAAEAHGAWVISDEIHAPLTLPGRRPLPFLEVSEAARARGVAITSASKAFNLAGLKLGLVVSAHGQVERLPEWLHWRAGYLGAVGAEAAFRHGDAWLDDVIDVVAGNHELLTQRLPREIGFTPPDASFLAWLDCRSLGLGDDPAAAFLARGRVALSSGLDFGAPGAGYARLNVATTPERVSEAVRRMAAGSTG